MMAQNNIQKVRFADEIVQFQTVTENDVEYLYLADVQRQFPTVTLFSRNGTRLSFIANKSNQDSKDLRIQADSNEIIDAIEPKTSVPILSQDQLNRIESKIDRIDENTQQILRQMRNMMTLMYEIHEYTTPRYFFILPTKHYDQAAISTVHNWFYLHYKLYFLCECSNDPKELHIASHNGYPIKKRRDFITKYGSYLMKTTSIIKVLLEIGKLILPQLIGIAEEVSSLQSSDDFTDIKDKINIVENFLQDPDTRMTYEGSSSIKKSQQVPIQGPALRELESYLTRIDPTRSLGNLYRIVTDNGHVRWVCQQHYDQIKYEEDILVYIKQFIAMGGKFDQKTKQAIVDQLNFSDTNVKIIIEALTKGFNISKLILRQCSIYEKHFTKLINTIINRSSIRCLELIDLNIVNFFGQFKYACTNIKINPLNQLLTIRFNQSDQNVLNQILRKSKIYRILQIYACDFLHNEQYLQQLLTTNTKFTELIVNYANNIGILKSIFNFEPNHLQRLKLNHSLEISSVANVFCQLLKTNKSIVELDLIDSIGFLHIDFLQNLFQTLKQHESIKQVQLHISSIENSDEKQKLLIDFLQNYQFLTRLRLSNSIISSELLQNLVETIEKHRLLTRLEFYHCNLNQNHIEQLKRIETKEFSYDLMTSQRSSLKWKQDAQTIVEGCNHPEGIYVDDQQKAIYIADYSNHCIVKWKFNEKTEEKIDQLNYPTDITVNRNSKTLIICDRGNRRIVQWSLEDQQEIKTIIENIGCYGLTMNENGDFFVSDHEKHEVKRWREGEKEGTIVAGGNGQGAELKQLNSPTFIFIDRQETIYVSDSGNHRVMKWMRGAKEGFVVAGGQGQGNSLKQLSHPYGLIVNEMGDIYVADSGNHRIMCWPLGSEEGRVVVGGNGSGQSSNQFYFPVGLSLDVDNNLYVVDGWNNRIQQFEIML